MRLICLLPLFAAVASAAEPTFTGKWRMSDFEASLRGGKYVCVSCGMGTETPTDGKDYPSKTQPGQTGSVSLIGKRGLEVVVKQNGRVIYRRVFTVSEDGKTLEAVLIAYPEKDGEARMDFIKGTRLGPVPSGMHPLNGKWQERSTQGFDAFTYEQTSSGMKHTEPGVEYDAKFDGKDYPVKGGDSGRTVALRRINALTVEEIWKAGGKEEFRSRMTLAADGKSLKNEILVDGKVTRSETALRQ